MRSFGLMVLACVSVAIDGDRARHHATPPGHGDSGPILLRPAKPRQARFGPPPPGYIRIRGEAVPGWKPQDMHASLRSTRRLAWSFLGPRPITNEYWSGGNASGRVVSIAVHPNDPDTAYAASASGGLWKTTDAGVNWSPLTDELPNLNSGSVAIAASAPGTIYLGTGEWTLGASGDGMFRSTDGGVNWQRVGTTAQVGSTCSQVVVDPTDPNTVHVTGPLGYVRTVDGGANWTVTLSGNCSDVVMDPGNPSVLYCGRRSAGIYKSTNAGLGWTKLAGGLPASGFDRIVLALAPSAPDTVYAALCTGSNLLGLWKTVDGGTTWVQKPATPNFPAPQAWYDCDMAVDPTNPDIVFAGGVHPNYAFGGVVRTTNGGDSWTDVTFGQSFGQVHPDMHAFTFGGDGRVWVGCDGGVWISEDGGTNWLNRNATLSVTQNYNIALHPTDPAQVMGGTQDNGTVARELDVLQWPQEISGDGGFLTYDLASPDRIYTTYVYLTIYRITSTSFTEITGPWGGDPVAFIAPLVMDPNDSNTLLGGTNRVWRTTTASTAATWTPISTSSVAGGGILSAIAVAVGASDTIYTGSSSGRVYHTTNASTWNNRSTGLPTSYVSDIMIDPADPQTAYVGLQTSSGGRIFKTVNSGVTWTNVTGDLPTGVSCRALAIDFRETPPFLVIGTGVGVYSSDDDGLTWVKDAVDLPNVNIGDLAIDTLHDTITAGTYGRGVWRSPLVADCNNNGIGDGEDIAGGTSDDCNSNGKPDDCEADCNTNGITDDCDLAGGTSTDCNSNGSPDDCEPDCNTNGFPDDCDLSSGTSDDCDGNGTPDECPGGLVEGDLVVTSNANNDALQYDGVSGSLIGTLVPSGFLNGARGATPRPNGNLLMCSGDDDRVVEFQPDGTLVGDFVTAGLGGIDQPVAAVYGPNGNLFVAGTTSNNVIEYDGDTGALVATFTSGGSLSMPTDLTFGPTGDLYVCSNNADKVLRFHGTTGAFISDFVSAGSGGLTLPQGLVFGPDDNLYVTSSGNDAVLRYNGVTGGFLGTFVASGSGGLDNPAHLMFLGPGAMLVASSNTGEVLEFDGSSGAFLRVFASGGGLAGPWGLALLTTVPCPAPGDCDGDGDVTPADFTQFINCQSGPGGAMPGNCDCADLDGDNDADVADFAAFQMLYPG